MGKLFRTEANSPTRAVALALLFLCAWDPAARTEEIRIEVSRGHGAAKVTGEKVTATEGPDATLLELKSTDEHALAAKGEALSIDGRIVQEPLVLKPGATPLSLDGKRLPGRVEVWAEKGGLIVVNALDLEEYVAAVVTSEMPSTWPLAALEAQAVAARTYAVAQKIAVGPGARAHLGASVLDQVYAGAAHLGSGAREAAKTTYGMVLTWNAAPIAAYFSSSCGGKSESAEAAFEMPKGSSPYLPAQSDGGADDAAPNRSWTVKLSCKQLTQTLRKAKRIGAAEIVGVAITGTTPSGRAREVRLSLKGGATLSMKATELRQLIGYTKLPSLDFQVAQSKGIAIFKGHGSGHGVGLCQWGARGRAEAGASYDAILAHYYPGAEIRQMY